MTVFASTARKATAALLAAAVMGAAFSPAVAEARSGRTAAYDQGSGGRGW